MSLRVLAFAVADDHMPPPGAKGRKARLPDLAVRLAREAVGERTVPELTAVEFGTAYGSLTETESFVENMIREREATPKPRHFSASVHNAMASRVAMALGAKGPCRTFVHGELSFVQAVRSARRSRFALVGGLDECTPYVDRGRAACGLGAGGEGGAVFYCGDGPALAELSVGGEGDVCWDAADYGEHPAACAVAVARAIDALADPAHAARIAIDVTSRFGEQGRLLVTRC